MTEIRKLQNGVCLPTVIPTYLPAARHSRFYELDPSVSNLNIISAILDFRKSDF